MAPELKRKLDYSDYLATPDDGKRYEIVDGDLFVTPSPSPNHQRVSRRLQRQLGACHLSQAHGAASALRRKCCKPKIRSATNG